MRSAVPVSTVCALCSALSTVGLAVQSARAGQIEADLVLMGGKLVTMDDSRPTATALAARGGRIVAVGDDAAIRPLVGPATRVIRLDGRLVIPGFIEGHGHFLDLGELRRSLDLSRAKNWDEIVALVVQAAHKAPPGAWIVGHGWHQGHWDKPPAPNVEGYPDCDGLSRVTPNNPVYLTHGTGHMCLANAKAMELAGIDQPPVGPAPPAGKPEAAGTAGPTLLAAGKPGPTFRTPDPPGGQILRNAQGRAIGAFRETASDLIDDAYERSRAGRTPAEIARERDEEIRLATAECLAKGVTTFHDAGQPFDAIDHFRRLAERGELKVRMWIMIREPLAALTERLTKYRIIGAADNHLTIRAIKEFMDGAIGTHGAWLLEPYNDVKGVGMTLNPPETIRGAARLAIENDFQLCTHAIGDRANRQVLDIYRDTFREHWEKMSRVGPASPAGSARVGPASSATSPAGKAGPTYSALRWRIEHAQHLNPAEIPRFAQLGVIASMQGCHATSDGPFVVTRLGQRRAQEGAYAWQALLKAGAMIINGSDVPVEDVSPILCFYSSVTRRMADGRLFFPEHCMTREQALRSYTINTAYAGFEEDLKGSLTPGKLADIVVLSKDIMTVPDAEIPQTEVLYTIIGGKVLYERGRSGER